MSSASVSIDGLNKVKLLRALWEASGGPATGGFFNPDYARKRVQAGYIGYFIGCHLHVDLSGDSVDAIAYDRNRDEEGAFAQVVASLRHDAKTAVFPPRPLAVVLPKREDVMPALDLGPGIGSPLRASCPQPEPSRLSHIAWSNLADFDLSLSSRLDERTGVFMQCMGQVTHAEFIEERNPNGMFIRCLFLTQGSTSLWHIAPFGEFNIWNSILEPEWAELRKQFHVKTTNERTWLVRK